jgi:solute carrier family 25 protein 39/40
MVEAERAENSWIASETSPSSSPVVIESSDFSITDGMRDVSGFGIASRPQLDKGLSENNIGFTERVFSAAGAAVLSAVTLNPLDVVKTRLQAQAAGMSYSHPLSNSIGRMAFFGPNMVLSLKFLFCMSVVLKVNTFYIFTTQLCNQYGFGSDVCRLEMFSFMCTRWC